MSDSSFKTHGITRPWVPWLLKKSISQYLTSLMQQASNSSWAKPCLLEGLWRAFSWGQDEKAAGNREMSRWPQPALGNPCCCSNSNPYTPRHVSLKLSNGWIQVSFKKPFPPATFVCFLCTHRVWQSDWAAEKRSAKCNRTLAASAQNSPSSDLAPPFPSDRFAFTPSRPLRFSPL